MNYFLQSFIVILVKSLVANFKPFLVEKEVGLVICTCTCFSPGVNSHTVVAVAGIWQHLSESCCACITPTSSIHLKYNGKEVVTLTFLKSIATNWACRRNLNWYLMSVVFLLSSGQVSEGKFGCLEEQRWFPLPFLHPCSMLCLISPSFCCYFQGSIDILCHWVTSVLEALKVFLAVLMLHAFLTEAWHWKYLLGGLSYPEWDILPVLSLLGADQFNNCFMVKFFFLFTEAKILFTCL